jgi:hypothetical protein
LFLKGQLSIELYMLILFIRIIFDTSLVNNLFFIFGGFDVLN